MRVTLSMQSGLAINYLQEASSGLQAAQEKVTTGKQINKPSDNPVGTGQAMRIQSTLDGITQYTANCSHATSQLSATDSALQSITTQLQQLQSVATAAANTGTTDSSTNQGYFAKIQGIEQSLVSLANTKYGDNYLFSGYNLTTSPLTATGGTPPYVYQQGDGAINVEIQPGQTVQTNVTADKVFNLDGSAGNGSKDIFTVINDLTSAIKSGDSSAISDSLGDIQTDLSNVEQLNAQVGATQQLVSNNTTALSNSQTQLSNLLSSITDADAASAIVQMQAQQNAYQAALAVTSQVMQLSLVNYMK